MCPERAPYSFVKRLDAGGCLLDSPIEFRHFAIVQRQRQLFRVLEVGVAKAFAHAGALGDRLHGERLETRVEDYRGAHVEQMLAALLGGEPARFDLFRWSSAKCHRDSCPYAAQIYGGPKVSCGYLVTQEQIFIAASWASVVM